MKEKWTFHAIFVWFTILKTITIPDVHESARDILKAWSKTKSLGMAFFIVETKFILY